MLTESLQISIPGTLPSGDYVEIVQGLAKKYGIDSAKAYITHEEVFVELASEGDDEAAFQQAVENMKRILPEALSRRRVDQGGGNSLHIGGNAAGSVIVLGDHNISKLEHHRLALPHPQSVDILAVLAEIRRLLTSLPGPDQRRVERALEEAVEEAETPEPRKDVIGESLEKAIVLAGKAESFAIKAAALKPHLIAAAAWLGQAWYKLAQ